MSIGNREPSGLSRQEKQAKRVSPGCSVPGRNALAGKQGRALVRSQTCARSSRSHEWPFRVAETTPKSSISWTSSGTLIHTLVYSKGYTPTLRHGPPPPESLRSPAVKGLQPSRGTSCVGPRILGREGAGTPLKHYPKTLPSGISCLLLGRLPRNSQGGPGFETLVTAHGPLLRALATQGLVPALVVGWLPSCLSPPVGSVRV